VVVNFLKKLDGGDDVWPADHQTGKLVIGIGFSHGILDTGLLSKLAFSPPPAAQDAFGGLTAKMSGPGAKKRLESLRELRNC
jgi:hypothetical protein